MKKFMVAILFLIPLIIVMTVNISGMIISATVKISVESILLKNRGEYINDVYINFNEYDDVNKYYLIDTVCYPKLAKVNLGWSSSDPSVAYVIDGKVFFVGYGEVTITTYSNENININARCNFYVSGDTIYSIDIIEYGQQDIEENININVFHRILLDKIIIPANALKDKIISWSSSDINIVTVDDNGVITGKSIGICDVTISIAEEDKIITDNVTINVLPSNNILRKEEIYISGNSVDISNYTTNNGYSMTTSGSGTIEDTTLTYTGSGRGEVILEINYNGTISELVVNFTDGNYLLGFRNLDILQSTKWKEGNIIWAGSANLVLTPIVLNDDYNGNMPEIAWKSSDLETIRVEDGRIYALDGGLADITISSEGFVDGVLSMEVTSPMESVSLVLDKFDDIKGIEGVRVFGIKSYHYDENEVGYIDNTLQLKVNSFRPLDAEQIYDYRSSNTDYATIDENGIITFKEAGINKNVFIYIVARYSVSARPVSDYYEFHIVEGVNIGLDVNAQDNTVENPNYETYNSMKEILENNEIRNNVVLHCDVYLPINGNCYTLHGSIYGNGYKYDGQYYIDKLNGSNMFNVNYNYFVDELFIRNLTINSSFPTDDFMVYLNNGGIPISITSNVEEMAGKIFIMKYCIMQYAFSHFYICGGNVLIEGSILRNTAGPTISCITDHNNVPEVTLKNNIFSNIIAPIMIMLTNFNLTDKVPMEAYGTLNLVGNNYIYNWKEIQDVRADIIPEGTLPGNFNSMFNDIINDTMRKELKGDKYKAAKVDGKDPITGFKKEYINFSILVIGIWREASSFHLNYDPAAFNSNLVDVAKTDIGTLIGSSLNYPCYVLSPINNLTVPNETYELDSKTLKRLRGEY